MAWLEYMKARRDLHLRLRWPHLQTVLGHIVAIGRNVTEWKLRFGRHLDFYHGGLVWEVGDDGIVRRHPKVAD